MKHEQFIGKHNVELTGEELCCVSSALVELCSAYHKDGYVNLANQTYVLWQKIHTIIVNME